VGAEGAVVDGLGALALEVAFEALELAVVQTAKVCCAALHTPYRGRVREPALDALDDLGDAPLGDVEVGGEFFLSRSLSAVGEEDGLVALAGGAFFAGEGAVVGFLAGGGHRYLRRIADCKVQNANCKMLE
jgi:hypothetical protein